MQPVNRVRLESLFGRSVDLVTDDGSRLVVTLGIVTTMDGEDEVAVEVLAVERQGEGRHWSEGDSGRIPVRQVQSVRPVVFLGESGM